MADRPPVEQLVHNLEHGYTIAWYRDGAPSSDVSALERIAKTFSGEDYNPEDKFIAAPWADSDGGAFPAGKNVVLSRWTADPNDPGDTTKQFGVRQSCAAVSGQAIKDFMAKYPVANSPEPERRLTRSLSHSHTLARSFERIRSNLSLCSRSFLGEVTVSNVYVRNRQPREREWVRRSFRRAGW